MLNFLKFLGRVTVIHTLTYSVYGIVFSYLFNYSQHFFADIVKDFLRPSDHPVYMYAPLIQVFRGALFAIGLYPYRRQIIESRLSILKLWLLIMCIGVFSTIHPTIGSIEGMIYSRIPLYYHLIHLPEIVCQTLTFSICFISWEQLVEKITPTNKLVLLQKGVIVMLFGSSGIELSILILSILLSKTGISFHANEFKFLVISLVFIFVSTISIEFSGKRLSTWYYFALYYGIFSFCSFYINVVGVDQDIVPLSIKLILNIIPSFSTTIAEIWIWKSAHYKTRHKKKAKRR